MTDQEIVARINGALVEEFELDPNAMTPDATLFDALKLDSLDMVDLVVVLEKTFQCKVRDEEGIRQIRTLGDIHGFIIRKARELEAASRG
jgi:acyl carrier protein